MKKKFKKEEEETIGSGVSVLNGNFRQPAGAEPGVGPEEEEEAGTRSQGFPVTVAHPHHLCGVCIGGFSWDICLEFLLGNCLDFAWGCWFELNSQNNLQKPPPALHAFEKVL